MPLETHVEGADGFTLHRDELIEILTKVIRRKADEEYIYFDMGCSPKKLAEEIVTKLEFWKLIVPHQVERGAVPRRPGEM